MGQEVFIDKPAYFAEEAISNWKREKWACFSGSEFSALMIPGKTPKGSTTPNMFSDGGISYIKRVAIQRYTAFHDDDKVETLAMRKGKIREPQAAAYLNKITGYDLTYHGGENPLFVKYCANSGASPDMTKYNPDGTVAFGAELKCREDSAHWDFIQMIAEKGDSLKSIHLADFNYDDFCQCQFNIMAAGDKCDFWLYMLYNEFFPVKHRGVIMKIEKDLAWQSKAKIRLKQAIVETDKLIALINAA